MLESVLYEHWISMTTSWGSQICISFPIGSLVSMFLLSQVRAFLQICLVCVCQIHAFLINSIMQGSLCLVGGKDREVAALKEL